MKVNSLVPKNKVQPNQVILIPLRKSVDLKKIQSLKHIKWPITHCVKGGESVRSLARYYRTTVCILIQYLFPFYNIHL